MTLSKNHKIHLIVALLLFALVELILPVQYGLTKQGKDFLAVFIALVYMWMTIETFVPSIIALAAFGIMQVTSSSAIFTSAFGNTTVAIFLFACIMITAARECGIMKKIALWFISRKATAGHPYIFMFFLALANYVLGALVTNTYSLLITAPVLLSVCDRLHYKRGDKFYISVFLLSMWSVLGGANALPFAKTIFLSMEAATSSYDISISYAQIMAMGVPIGLIWPLLGLLVIKFVIKPDFTNYMSYNPSDVADEMKAVPLDRRGKMVTWGFFVMMLLWCLTVFNGVFGFATYLNTIGFHIIACAVIAVLCIIQVDNQPVLSLRNILPKLSWPVAGFLALIMFTSSAFSNEAYGIKEFLITLLGPIFSDVSPVLLVIVGIVIAGVLTNLISNVVTCVVVLNVFLPLLLSVGDLQGISPAAFALALTVASGMSCATPSSFPGASLIFGEHLTMAESFKANIIMVVLGIALCILPAFIY